MLEARNQSRYREFILADEVLRKHTSVPEVFPELSTARVLTGRLISGESIEKAVQYPQSIRNAIARTLLIVSIKELFIWRLVQSDPNYGNFLYNHAERKIHLLDFGATREYRKEFVDDYMVLVWSAANKDRQRLLEVSRSLGFLTGASCPGLLYMRFLSLSLSVSISNIQVMRRRSSSTPTLRLAWWWASRSP